MMKVSFVPCLDVLDPRNRGVIVGNNPWTEDGALMTFEAPPHELVELGDVRKAPTGAMYGNEAFSLFDERQKIFPLECGDLRMVRIKKQSIELAQVLGIVEGLRTLVDEEGPGVLLSGLVPRLLYLGPLASLVLATNEVIASILIAGRK